MDVDNIKIEKMIESFKENNMIGNSIVTQNIQNKTFFWPFIESPFFTDIEIDQRFIHIILLRQIILNQKRQ